MTLLYGPKRNSPGIIFAVNEYAGPQHQFTFEPPSPEKLAAVCGVKNKNTPVSQPDTGLFVKKQHCRRIAVWVSRFLPRGTFLAFHLFSIRL
jgi:hypothetical protein